jgi:hypothetical protein
MRSLFAAIEKLDNGYVVKYPEAVCRKQRAPSPLDGIGDAQIELMVNLGRLQSGDEDEPWKGNDDERASKLRDRIKQMRARMKPQMLDVWSIEEREFFCQSFAGITKALEAAESARQKIEALTRQGIRIQPSGPTGVVGIQITPP